jgi:hypothetical protein
MGAYAEEQGRTKGGPPAVGKLAGARVDEMFHADLATLARAGMGTTDALRWSVNQLARAFEEAWKRGTVPEGVRPEITMWVGKPKAKPESDAA